MMMDNDEIERRKREFFGEEDSVDNNHSEWYEVETLLNRQVSAESNKKCPFCQATIGANAIFCIHCSSIVDEAEHDNISHCTDITWEEDGAIFHHLGNQHYTYEEIKSSRHQQLPETKDYRCSQCNSDHIQSFLMAYRSGTERADFSGSGYSFDAGNVNVSGTSFHQTQLAELTSPPSRPRPFLPAIIATGIILFFSFMPLLSAYLTSPTKFAFVLFIDFVLIIAVYVLCGVFAPGKWRKYEEKYKSWEQAWICLRCGHSFLIN